MAREARIAAWTSGTSSGGSMLVNRLPGPATITSARSSASQTWGMQRGRSGIRPTRRMRPAGRGDRGLAAHHAAVLELRDQRHQLARRRQHRAAGADHPRRDLHRVREVVGHVGERGQHQVADRVSVQAVAGAEPVLEDVGDQRVIVRQRREAVADVARRNHVELGAQPSRAAAVVGGRHDGDEPIAPASCASSGASRRAAGAARAGRWAGPCRRRARRRAAACRGCWRRSAGVGARAARNWGTIGTNLSAGRRRDGAGCRRARH